MREKIQPKVDLSATSDLGPNNPFDGRGGLPKNKAGEAPSGTNRADPPTVEEDWWNSAEGLFDRTHVGS